MAEYYCTDYQVSFILVKPQYSNTEYIFRL